MKSARRARMPDIVYAARSSGRVLIAMVVLLLVLAGCGQGVRIESVPGPIYMLLVDNPLPRNVEILVDDGARTRELGTVEANSAREFVISAPASTSVTVIARSRGSNAITRDVRLDADATQRITLTP